MTSFDIFQVILFLGVLLLLVKPVGAYMAMAFADSPNGVNRVGGWLERLLYRLAGVRAKDMGWRRYAIAMLVFNLLGISSVYALQRLQAHVAAEPAAVRRACRPIWRSTRRSASPPTPTGRATAAKRR